MGVGQTGIKERLPPPQSRENPTAAHGLTTKAARDFAAAVTREAPLLREAQRQHQGSLMKNPAAAFADNSLRSSLLLDKSTTTSLTSSTKTTSAKPSASAGPAVANDGPRRMVSDIDYEKWESYSKQVEQQDKLEASLADAEAVSGGMMAGCAHDHTKERLLYEKSTKDKIDAADRFRAEGVRVFQQMNYGLAAQNFRKALLQFDYAFPDTAEEEARLKEVKLPCHLNLAACKLKMQDLDEVLTQCRLAIEMDPNSAKAFYRRGIAYLERDNFAEAETALRRALECQPDRQIRQSLALLDKKKKQYSIRNQRVAAAMFSGNDEEDSAKPIAPKSGDVQ
eukprot:Selendium_serpulae@DN3017_c0_g1_i1.p1